MLFDLKDVSTQFYTISTMSLAMDACAEASDPFVVGPAQSQWPYVDGPVLSPSNLRGHA